MKSVCNSYTFSQQIIYIVENFADKFLQHGQNYMQKQKKKTLPHFFIYIKIQQHNQLKSVKERTFDIFSETLNSGLYV